MMSSKLIKAIKKSKDLIYLIYFGVGFFIIVAFLAFFFSVFNKDNSRKTAFKYLAAVTEGVTQTVDLWVGERKNMLSSLSEQNEIKNAFTDTTLIPQIINKIGIANQSITENIFFASSKGELLNKLELSHISSLDIKNIIKSSNPLYIFQIEQTHEPIFILIQALLDKENKILGYIGFTTNWNNFISKFIKPVKVGETGYLAITDSKGRNIGHHDSTLTLKLMSKYEWMQKLINEKNGVQAYKFKGEDKLMAFQQSEQTKWIINASIDEDELVERTIRMRNSILYISFAILIIVIFTVTLVNQIKLQEARKKLLESERNLRLLFRCGEDGDMSECSVFSTCLIHAFERGNDSVFIHRVRPDGSVGKFLKVNESFLSFFNCSLEQISKTNPQDILGTTIKKNYGVLINNLKNNKVFAEELETVKPGGFIELRLFKIRANQELAILGFVRDITDRVIARRKLKEDRDYLDIVVKKRTSEILSINDALRKLITEKDEIAKALQQSEARYRSFVERANDGIMLIDSGQILFANNKICSLLQYELEELTEKKFQDIIIQQDRERVVKEHEKRLKGSATSPIFETILISKSGEKVEVEINSGIIYEDETPRDFLFIRDIRLRKRHEEERRIQQEQMIQTDKLAALGTMLTGVAHEINNPNNAIMLNSPLIKEAWHNINPILEKFSKENGDFVISGMPYSYFNAYMLDVIEDIYRSSGRIKNIVEELKTFAKPDTSTLYDIVQINDVIRSSLNLMTSQIKKTTNNLTIDFDESLPYIKGSFVRLEQVIVNLLQNACHAIKSPDKAIRIKTSYIAEEHIVKIEIKDEGCGISAENLKQIFNPFFTTKRERGGTGLGLSVSLKIIKEHEGTLTFLSKEGEGTIATIKLPNK